MLVHGIAINPEKPRKGTKCALCGEYIADFDFVKTSTNHQSSCYVHADCIRMRMYHEPFRTPNGNKLPLFDNTKKGTSKEQIIITPEVEFDNNYQIWSTAKKAQFVAQFGMYLEEDCTVGAEGHILSRINFHGLYEWYANLEKWVDMTTPNCGHHINMSWYDMKACEVYKIRQNVHALFGTTEKWMREHPAEVKRIFGRNFGGWAQDNGRYVHGSWMNLENDYCDAEARIEYRLPHFVNAKQIVWCAFLLKDWTKELRAFCKGEQNADKTAKAILSHVVKAANGKALYQRPERNGKAKKTESENLPFDF